MKIGILTNTYPPNLNGVAVAVNSLEKALIKLGHEVYIATPKISGQEYGKNVCPLNSATIPKSISSDLKLPYLYLNEASIFFKQNKIDIIHTHDTIFGGIEGLVIAMRLDIPAVHTFHTMIENYNYFPIIGYQKFIQSYINNVCNGYQHVIAPSTKVYDYLLNLGVKVPISQIYNVPSLDDLDSSFSLDDTKNLAKELNIDTEKDFVFISFCRLAKEKSVDKSLEILTPLFKKYSEVKYLILGDGPEKENLEKITKKNRLDSRIIFCGKYKRKDLKKYCNLAKVFIFTSVTENLPTNLFEAVYFGLPVISIKDKSIDYVVENNFNGLVSNLENLTAKAEELILDKTLRQRLANNSKLIITDIQPQKIASQHIGLYQKVIEMYKEKLNNQSFLPITEKLENLINNSTNIIEFPLEKLDTVLGYSIKKMRSSYEKFLNTIFKS